MCIYMYIYISIYIYTHTCAALNAYVLSIHLCIYLRSKHALGHKYVRCRTYRRTIHTCPEPVQNLLSSYKRLPHAKMNPTAPY